MDSPLEATSAFVGEPVMSLIESKTLVLSAATLLLVWAITACDTSAFKAVRQLAGVMAMVSLLLTCWISEM